jgi:CHAD domain-containing protein
LHSRVNPDHLIRYLTTQSKMIACMAPKVARRPSGKSLHILRVATRRALAALWCLRHSSAHLVCQKLSHDLKKLEEVLGPVRELDVAIHDANLYGIRSNGLEDRRKELQRELLKRITVKKRHQLEKEFKDLKESSLALSPIRLNEARSQLVTRLHLQLKRKENNQTRLHQVRIVLKKARYALEAMGQPVGPLKHIQDVLGDAHDLERLQELTGKRRKIKAKQKALNIEAIRLAKTTLTFALHQLDDGYLKNGARKMHIPT